MPTRKILPVSHTRMRQAIDAIGERRADFLDERGHRCEDPDLAEWSDDPLELLDFVCRCRRVPRHVLAEDVLDALIVLEYVRKAVPALPSRLDTWEYTLLTMGVSCGHSYGALGRHLGVGGRQAVRARILRHEASLRDLPRNDRVLVQARKAETRERDWLAKHGGRLREGADDLLSYREACSPYDLAEEFDQLAEALERWPEPDDPHDLKRVRSVALHLRELLRCIDEAQVAEVPSELLTALQRLTQAHSRVLHRHRS